LKKYHFYAGEYLKSEGSGKNGECDDGNDPAEKSYDIAEGYVIRFYSLHLSEFHNQDCSKSGNTDDDNRPTDNQPFEEICQELPPRSTCKKSVPKSSKPQAPEIRAFVIRPDYSSLARRLCFLMRA
jgi:hypothetical protein